MINANKKQYYKHVDVLSKSDPIQIWVEIKFTRGRQRAHEW